VLLLGSSASATFHGANGKIVFSGLVSGNYDIFSMNADGSGVTDLTRNDATEHQPAGSPDGKKIAFSRYVDSDDAEIFVMNADGSGQRNLTNNPAVDVYPAWSPDGTRIAFTRCTKTDCDLFVMNADGSDQRDLVGGPVLPIAPSWSPDGTKIAFDTNCCGAGVDGEILVVGADGSGETDLTNSHSTNDFDPDWSPDGARIAFSRCTPLDCEVAVMNADGSGQTDLTRDPVASDLESHWAPDGKELVFSRCTSLGCKIAIVKADGSGRRTVPNGVPNSLEPVWLAGRPQPTCRVPKVVGVRLATAKLRIRKAGCVVGRVRTKRSRRPGIVVAQSPRPGTRLPHGGRVDLLVGRK
jgi:Tol biopolymer transport system component